MAKQQNIFSTLTNLEYKRPNLINACRCIKEEDCAYFRFISKSADRLNISNFDANKYKKWVILLMLLSSVINSVLYLGSYLSIYLCKNITKTV